MTQTDRLYYTDALRTSFEARVLSSTLVEEGAQGHHQVVLDVTAFYPTSGGQPFDVGSLGDRAVVDVVDHESGAIVHVTDGPLRVGDTVTGVVDWARRFDHMQQHTGQHILSAAFEQSCHARTESFHLGNTHCTIDLAREVSAAEIDTAESLASAVVFEDRVVRVRFVSEEEAAALPLRKDPTRSGTLRLVEVDDFDLSACGGTHVPSTGRIGVIAVTGWERFKGGTRVAFVCGGRALREHRRLRDLMSGLVRQLTVAAADVGPTVERLQADVKTHLRTIRQLREAAAEQEAITLLHEAEMIDGLRRVIVGRPGWDMAALKTLATAIVGQAVGRGACVAVVTGGDTPVPPVPVVVARTADAALDAGAWIKRITADLGGRGGGRPETAQGVVDATVEQVLAFARDTVR